MAGFISVPVDEGISIKNENDDPEINAMALKIKKENVQNTNDCEDICSIKGEFSWEQIGITAIPYIMRIINSEKLKFVSVRVAESQLLSRFLKRLRVDVITCASVRSYFITESEAKLLNEINVKHSDKLAYGKEPFQTGKDYIVRLEDVIEFYTFLDVCYCKYFCPQIFGTQKCGFICINSEFVVPYCYKNNRKYIPLFFFEGEMEYLMHCALKLENWDLAYLKFCLKIQGIRNELFADDSCIVISLDDIKNYFPPDTSFEEYWPSLVVDNNSQIYPPGAWIRAPSAVLNYVPTSENILPQNTLTAPTPVVPSLNMPITNSTYQNGWTSAYEINQTFRALLGLIPPPPSLRASSSSTVSNSVIYITLHDPLNQMR